ncbi:MAG: hypothetical protein HQ517_03895 [SAR324 cluster bacterium]|nr:hypothetical protein [SAR324 cluster bacterium]
MKALKIAIVMILLLNGSFSLYNWLTEKETSPGFQTQLQQESAPLPAAEGLDLSALTALTKEIRSGQELERRLNQKEGINNLDLNNDKKVDYLFVSEFGDVQNKIGYSLTVQPQKEETQEVAAITVEKNGDRAEIQVVGNEQIYGDQAIFNDWSQIEREKLPEQPSDGQQTMYHSYFYPRPLWFSPFYFGFYPGYYSFFPIMGRSTYMTRVNRNYNTSSVGRGANRYQGSSGKQVTNPNRGKVANRGITRSLQKPTNTQKKFQATSSRNLRSGGFGSRKTVGSSSGQSRSQVGTSRSRSIFGGGSVRSSSSRSRSFSFGK